MRVVPGKNPARSDELPLAGLGLQATDSPQVIQVCGEQWCMGIYFDGLGRKPFGRNSPGKFDRRSCSDTWSLCPIVINKTIDHGLINRHRSTGARHEIAESPEPTEIDLGRCALVTELREIRRYAVHLVAQPSVAKAPKYPRILEIQFQHRTLSSVGMTGTPWPGGESEDDIMWRPSPPAAAKSRATRRHRHIIAPDTYEWVLPQRLLHQHGKSCHTLAQ